LPTSTVFKEGLPVKMYTSKIDFIREILGHVLPFEEHPDIYTHQTSYKTEEIACHQAESFSNPPANPAKK
jgi:hypothetical protein